MPGAQERLTPLRQLLTEQTAAGELYVSLSDTALPATRLQSHATTAVRCLDSSSPPRHNPSMSARVALAIMARYPAAGAVKTRLARAIGAERACTLYRAFLHDLEERFTGGRRVVIWTFHPPDSDFAACVSAGACRLPQSGDGLGERMLNCFRRLCADGFEKVILIGTDAPHLRDQWLDEAEAALDSADVVLGPTDDGGYYLIAMRQPHDIFSGIAMSTAHVLADTVAKARSAGLTVRLLARTFDIDEADDLSRLHALIEGDRLQPPLRHTAALLKEWSHGRA